VADGNGADVLGIVILSTGACTLDEDNEFDEEVDLQVCATNDGDADIIRGRPAELEVPDDDAVPIVAGMLPRVPIIVVPFRRSCSSLRKKCR
jgi:hypothetical protein